MRSPPQFEGAAIGAVNDRRTRYRLFGPERSKRHFLLPENRRTRKTNTGGLGRNSRGARMHPAKLWFPRRVRQSATGRSETAVRPKHPEYILSAGGRGTPASTLFADFR